MTTGPAWDVSDPTRPVADFDPDAKRDIPFDWREWLADAGTTYASHVFIAEPPLQVAAHSEAAGVITARVQIVEPYKLHARLPLTCRITGADGQIEDQTVWLRVANK